VPCFVIGDMFDVGHCRASTIARSAVSQSARDHLLTWVEM
jgi:hypothetical protein